MPSGIEGILQDHALIRDLFDRFDVNPEGAIAGQIFELLSVHDEAEHAALYPLALLLLNKGRVLLRYEKAHATIKAQIDHARCQEGTALVTAVEQLGQTVLEHVEDEEKNLLPALGKKASREQLETLATRITQNRQRVG